MGNYSAQIIELSKDRHVDEITRGKMVYAADGPWETYVLAEELVRLAKWKRTPGRSYRPFAFVADAAANSIEDTRFMIICFFLFPLAVIIMFGLLMIFAVDMILLPIGLFNYFYEKNSKPKDQSDE